MGKDKFEKRAFADSAKFAKEIIDIIDEEFRILEPSYYLDVETVAEIIENAESVGEIADAIQESLNGQDEMFDIEVIGYGNAIEYLAQNDQSLELSLELAKSLGFGIDDIHSELLAGLLKTEEAKDDFAENYAGVETFIEMLAENYMGEDSEEEE